MQDMKAHYFDYASTTPMHPEVLETYQQTQLRFYANPDGMHDDAREVEHLYTNASRQIANILQVQQSELLFTSGATEANNMAIFGATRAYAHRGKHIVTTAFEHASVQEPIKYLASTGYEVTYVPVDENGLIDLQALEQAVREDTVLVSCIYVHNELGTIQPLSLLAKTVRAANPRTIIHIDMAQAIGKAEIDLQGVDLATFSAHKFYGPKSSGMLMKKEHIQLMPLLFGGQQQGKLRPGTVNVPIIAATSKALRLAVDNQEKHISYVQSLNDDLRAFFAANEMVSCTINDSVATPYILHLTIHDNVTQVETYMHAFNQHGIELATRSTCHSKSVHLPNEVLVAVGMTEAMSRMGIRISLSHLTTHAEIQQLKDAFKAVETLLFK